MIEYLARQALAMLRDDVRHITPNAEWYLDLMVGTWFSDWETEWEELCIVKGIDRTIEVLAAVQSPNTTALWLANHYIWVKWYGKWLYVTYEQLKAPYRDCQMRTCPRHRAIIMTYENGVEVEHGSPDRNLTCWRVGTCQPD